MTGLTSLWVLYFQEDLKFWISCLVTIGLLVYVSGFVASSFMDYVQGTV